VLDEQDLIGITPQPFFAGLIGHDYWVTGRFEMFARMGVFGIIATTNMTASHTQA
jgi:hypothetical protein